jgi:delta14-sterol reductase
MLLTYLYSIYFATLLVHREGRDDHACSEKYGTDWDEYRRKAKWRIITGVF